MLLRRITKHVTDQNWFAVFIDFLIVVVGILIAFQITEWNEARDARSAEMNHLISLENETTFSINSLEKTYKQLTEQQSARRTLYEYIKSPDTGLPNVKIEALLQGALFNIERINISQVTFDALSNSGQLSLIGDPELIKSLQTLNTLVISALKIEDESLQFTFSQTDPFLIEEIDMENVFNSNLVTGGDNGVIGWVKGIPDVSISPEIIKSVKLKNLVLFRAELTRGRLLVLRSLIEQYEMVLRFVKARQHQIGAN